jgi:hypothetical protein
MFDLRGGENILKNVNVKKWLMGNVLFGDFGEMRCPKE